MTDLPTRILYFNPFGTIVVADPDPVWGDSQQLLPTLHACFAPAAVEYLNAVAGRYSLYQLVLLVETVEAGIQLVQRTGLDVARFITPWGHRSWEQLIVDDVRAESPEQVIWLDPAPARERESLRLQIPDTELHLITTDPFAGVTTDTADILHALYVAAEADELHRQEITAAPHQEQTAEQSTR